MKAQKTVPVYGKPIHYASNGTGRDLYIYSDNGGLTQPTIFNTDKGLYRPRATMVFRNSHEENRRNFKGRAQSSQPLGFNALSGKVTKYRSDGSGRDGYIKVNDGGNTFQGVVGANTHQVFNKTLRSYEKTGSSRSSSCFGNSTFYSGSSGFNFRSQSDVLRQQTFYKTQSDNSERLSQPKYVKEQKKNILGVTYRPNNIRQSIFQSVQKYSSNPQSPTRKLNHNNGQPMLSHTQSSRLFKTNSDFMEQQQYNNTTNLNKSYSKQRMQSEVYNNNQIARQPTNEVMKQALENPDKVKQKIQQLFTQNLEQKKPNLTQKIFRSLNDFDSSKHYQKTVY